MTVRTCLRAILFVPANRPDRIQKALATNADIICVDLEDGVAINAKDSARRVLLAFLAAAEFDVNRLSVRINDPTTDPGRHDLAAIAELGQPLELLLIPKVTDAATVDSAFELCPNIRKSMILIETKGYPMFSHWPRMSADMQSVLVQRTGRQKLAV